MIWIEIIGRQPTPAFADLGMTYDRRAEAVRFRVTKPWADVFSLGGVTATAQWLAANGRGGADAVPMAADGETIVGDWTPGEEALLFAGDLRAELRLSVAETVVWHSLPLTLRVLESVEDARKEQLLLPKYKEVRLSVTQLDGGAPTASVDQDGEHIDFSLGIPIVKGDPGSPGPTPNLTIGEVTAQTPGAPATASLTGTPENPVLNLGLPQADISQTIQRAEAATDDARALIADAHNRFVHRDTVGQPGSVCPLDGGGKVPPAYLPARSRILFGARWDGGTSPACARLGDAVGMRAAAMIGSTPVINDFDYSFVATRLCNIDPGSVTPKAYGGDPDFSVTGANGNVFVEIPIVYYRRAAPAGNELEIWLSDGPYPDFVPRPLFVRPNGTLRDRVYVAAYPASYDAGGDRLRSVSGVFPDQMSGHTRPWFLQKAALSNPAGRNCYFTETAEWRSFDQMAGMVEFATLNMQAAIGMGYVDMRRSSTDTPVIAETGVNRIILPNNRAQYFPAGVALGIGAGLWDEVYANNRTVTSVTQYDAANVAIHFDGDPVNVPLGCQVHVIVQKTGGGDALGAHSGRAAGTDGRTSVVRRGVQEPYGSHRGFIANEFCNNYNIVHLCKDPAQYATGTIAGGQYTPIGYAMTSNTGDVGAVGYDAAYPWAMYATETGGSSTTKFCDVVKTMSATGTAHYLMHGGGPSGAGSGPWATQAYEHTTSGAGSSARLVILPD